MTKTDYCAPAKQLECFIPYLFDDLVEMCLADNQIKPAQQTLFREFCTVLTAYNNFISHRKLASLDKDYALFNPDLELKLYKVDDTQLDGAAERVVEAFCSVASDANYRPLSNEEMQESFDQIASIKVQTAVDLDEYCRLKCYVRGDDTRVFTRRNWRLQQIDEPVATWRRVLLLLQFKDDAELTDEQLKRRKKTPIPYQAGKVYLYQYKDVPCPDLEILFPNVRVSMNRLDRVLLGLPGVIAAIATIAKVGVKLALVAGVVAYVFFNKTLFGFDESMATDMMKVTVAVLGVLVAFGGLGFKQYSSIKNKRIGFMKKVSEQLFFHNIAMNKAAIDRVIDDGEDESCKEMLLAYYHLLTNKQTNLDRPALDTLIQDWMMQRHGTAIDFDIDDAIDRLKTLGSSIDCDNVQSLLTEDDNGTLHVAALPDAAKTLDYWWDNAFSFNNPQRAQKAA